MLVSSLESTLRTLANNLDAELAGLAPERSGDPALAAPGPEQHRAANRPETTLILGLSEAYGHDKTLMIRRIARLAHQCQAFIQRFGDGPVRILRAPARINILGEHVDYVSYIPTASLTFGSRQHDMVMMFRPSPTGFVRGGSTDSRFQEFEFDIRNGPPLFSGDSVESEWLEYLYSRPTPAPGWANYVIGACGFAGLKYPERIGTGFDFLIDSTIPAGAGASSSSALSVLSGAAVRLVNRVEYQPAELAMDSSRAEWYVGTRGGSMDHITILMARPDSAISISYRDDRPALVPLPSAGHSWITFFTHPANKGQEVMNHYNDRALVSRILIPAILSDWRSTRPELNRLVAEGIRQFESGNIAGLELIESALSELPESIGPGRIRKSYPAAFDECSRAFPALVTGELERDFTVRKRAFHHVGEVRRVAHAAEALKSAKGREDVELARVGPAMSKLGELLRQCHSSLRDLYEVSTEEVEELVRIIEASGLACGARMMGGGFGGNVLTLAPEANAGPLIDLVQQKYYLPRDRDGSKEGSIMVSAAGLGLSEIDVGQAGSLSHMNGLD